jgi:NADPH2:quinone reductase
MKALAIRVHEPGGPEVLRAEEIDVAAPGEGQALVRQTAVGLNFIDVYHRSGLYPLALPAVIGQEAAGVVEAVGPGVVDLAPGDRVAYAGVPGAYASARVAPASRLVKIPPSVSDRDAAALLLKGMTARYLLKATTKIGEGDTVVVHAAAGGTGQLLVRWALHLGATVVGVVGSDEKAAVVSALGAQAVVVSPRESFVQKALEITGGRGADVVYDSVGKDTFHRSLEALRTRGMLVSFGQSSGPIGAFEIGVLAPKCLYLTRPSLFAYTQTRAELDETAADVWAAAEAGVIQANVTHTFPLARAAGAHRALEGRRTTGATVLLP